MTWVEWKHVQDDHEVVILVDDFCYHARVTVDNCAEDTGNFVAFFVFDVGEFMGGSNEVSKRHLGFPPVIRIALVEQNC